MWRYDGHRTLMAVLSGCLIAGLLSAFTVYGQTVHVAPSETARNTPGTFTVVIESPQGRAPVALQWELSIPPALVIKAADIKIGEAAMSARKELTCAPGRKQTVPGGVVYACILAGGQEPIGNGPIVEVHYRGQADVEGAPIRVALTNIRGASADLKAIPMLSAEATIHIQ